MTHVVRAACFGCKYTDCVVVCPVECFYEDEQILYIHPDECIDCEACTGMPGRSYFPSRQRSRRPKGFIELNAEKGASVPVDHGEENSARRTVSFRNLKSAAACLNCRRTTAHWPQCMSQWALLPTARPGC